MGLQLHLHWYGGLLWEVAVAGMAISPLYMPILSYCLTDFRYLKGFFPVLSNIERNQKAYGKIDNGLLNT